MPNKSKKLSNSKEVGTRLAELRNAAGLSQQALAELFGVTQQSVARWELGTVEPPLAVLLDIAKRCTKSVDWILTGEGPTSSDDAPEVPIPRKNTNNGPHDLTPDDLDSYVKVNRYDIEASAGAGALVLDEHVVDQLTFKRSWLQGRKGWDPTELGLLQVRGDSMEPTLKGGDLILVNGERLGLHDGLYVVRLGDDVLVKRLRRIGPNEVEVISDNKEIYPPFVSKLNDGLHIIGEVVWFCRELR